MSRAFPATVYRGLKTATRRVVESFGPLKCAAPHSRIDSVSTLQRFYSQNAEDECRFIPVDVALDFMRDSGDVTLLRYMAEQLGFELADQPIAQGCVIHQTADRMAEGGKVISKLAATLADGHISAAEIKDQDLMRQLESVSAGTAALKAHFRQILASAEEAASNSMADDK